MRCLSTIEMSTSAAATSKLENSDLKSNHRPAFAADITPLS
jgi:hypothetical protein